MTVIGIGTDIIECLRIAKLIEQRVVQNQVQLVELLADDARRLALQAEGHERRRAVPPRNRRP